MRGPSRQGWTLTAPPWAGLITVLLTSAAEAQPPPAAGELDIYAPCPLPSCVLNTPLANSSGHLVFKSGLWLVGARQLMRLEIAESGDPLGSLVRERLTGHLLLGVGLWRRIDLGLDLPLVLHQDGLDTKLVRQAVDKRRLRTTGLADLRLAIKGTLIEEEAGRPALALLVDVVAPSGAPRELFGERSWVFAPALAVSKHIGRATMSGNLGARLRLEPLVFLGTEIEHEIFFRGALRYTWTRPAEPIAWGLLAALYGHTAADNPFGLSKTKGAAFHNSTELVAGVERQVRTSWGGLRFTVALAAGALPGYGSAGLRALLGVEHINREPEADDDRDRITNALDLCPRAAEDVDDYADSDGCPDLDNDADGVEDIDDECPLEPEDRDRFEDDDGCPETSDQDGDNDGVSDANDRCPEAAEDGDLFEDDDGCPDPDNDGDGLDDLHDVCPDQPEDQATSRDKDGCPDEGPGPRLVKLERGQLRTSRSVEFQPSKAAVSPRAKPVLNQVATLMRENATMRLRVVVTPTSPAPAAGGLARRRAREVVNYLTSRGVDRRRLEAVGLTQPQGTAAVVRFVVIAP